MAMSKEQLLAEIKRRGGAAKAPGFAAQLAALNGGGKAVAGGSVNFNEQTGQMNKPAPMPAPAAPGKVPNAAALEAQRAKLEMEMKRSAQGSKRQLNFANKLAAQRNAIQAAKTAAGVPLKHAVGVTGQQMVDTLASRANKKGGFKLPNGETPTFAEPLRPPSAGNPQPPTNQAPPAGQPQQPGQPQSGQPVGSPPQMSLPGMSIPGQGLPGSNPSMPAYNYQQVGFNGQQSPQDMIGSVYNQATGGTINQFNTAANRLRERLDSASQAALEQAQNRNIGRGFGNSGAQDEAAYNVNAGTQNAYAQGLNDLSGQFEGFRQQGLQTALGAGNLAQQGQQNFNALRQLDLSQLRDLSTNLLNNREGRGSAEKISGNELANRLALQQGQNQFQGGENALDRTLQQNLGQLNNQNENWRASLQQLLNSGSLFGGSSFGGGSGSSISGSLPGLVGSPTAGGGTNRYYGSGQGGSIFV